MWPYIAMIAIYGTSLETREFSAGGERHVSLRFIRSVNKKNYFGLRLAVCQMTAISECHKVRLADS